MNVCDTLQPHSDNAKRAVIPLTSVHDPANTNYNSAFSIASVTVVSLQNTYIADLQIYTARLTLLYRSSKKLKLKK